MIFTDYLTLYQYDYCPFCVKVRRFMSEHNIEIPLKDTLMDPSVRDELIELGGKGQVPALRIGDVVLYESDDIIRWLQENIVIKQAKSD